MEDTSELTQAAAKLRGINVHRVGDTIFMPLPHELWRPCDGCDCDVCKKDGTQGYWDTLAVSGKATRSGRYEHTWTVHYPDLHNVTTRKAKAIPRDK
jgi:hypothetical protein